MSDTELLVEISGKLGGIEGMLRGLDQKVTTHIEDDKLVAARVGSLEQRAAEQRGARRVVTAMATTLGTLSGAVGGFVSAFMWNHR